MAISLQLANSSSPVADFSMISTFTPNSYDVQINVLYFVSLTLALSVSSICILGKQWIREYQKDIAVSPCDAAQVRQMHFDSLQRWKVLQIMAILPVILLVAPMLFFAGLLAQLWNVSNRTTATAVLVIVALTMLPVIFTTVVPAWVSTRLNHSAFTPFRSPQAWIVFYIVLRLQYLYHPDDDPDKAWEDDDSRKVWKANHPVLNSWAEFDLHFLKIEPQRWFEHKISSVHCILRWVVKVLRKSSEMEKALIWCLQPMYYPFRLIEDEDALTHHVLHVSDDKGTPSNTHCSQYDHNVQNHGYQTMDSPVGRYRAELLLRSAHHEIDKGSGNSQEAWDAISYSCKKLWDCGIFYNHLEKEIMHRTSPTSYSLHL